MIIYSPWVPQPQSQKMSEQAAKHCCFSFGIHENNVFSGTKAILLNISLSLLFIVDSQSEYWMTRQSHIRSFNHVVMKGNLAHDKLQKNGERRVELQWTLGAWPRLIAYTREQNPSGFYWKYTRIHCKTVARNSQCAWQHQRKSI